MDQEDQRDHAEEAANRTALEREAREELAEVTIAELAHDLGAHPDAVRAFAGDLVTRNMRDTDTLPADVVRLLRAAWSAAPEAPAHQEPTNYQYLGDPAGSRSMTLTVRKINSIDADGAWITVWDEEGMECEVLLPGMGGRSIQAAMIEWGY